MTVRSPIYERMAALGGQMAEYSGVETAASYGDPDAEYRALVGSCGAFDLGWRGKILFTGEDRVRWLNGMTTNNVRDLEQDHGNYNFLLNAQGRIQGDLYVYNRGEYLLGDTERWQLEKLIPLLDRFIIMDDVEISDGSDKLVSIGVQGPGATGLLKQVGIQPPCADPMVVCDLDWNGVGISVTRMASDVAVTYEVWLSAEKAATFWDALLAAGADPVGTLALEKFRVTVGVPKYGKDIRDKDLPQETAQEHALNFTKGCYLGQEIVERIHSRGLVHRRFSGFFLDAAAPPGTKLVSGEKAMGEITSVERVATETGEKILALGYVRREAAPGTLLHAGDISATIAELPFRNI